MIIDCIIVEDEPLALERTKSYLQKTSYLNLIGEFNNGIDALGFMKINQVDLIFLDIEMDDLTGIELCIKGIRIERYGLPTKTL